MAERILFLTGRLAEPRLRRLLEGLAEPPFAWSIANIGVKVAALMTEPIVLRRLPRPIEADRVVFPGRAGLDPQRLSEAFGVRFERGPDEVADLPGYLGIKGKPADLSRHDVRIFAEIVDAVTLSEGALLARAEAMREQGADVVDIGCTPGVPFPRLEEVVRRLKAAGLRVSVDSGNPDELRRGALAGADFLLSLTEATLDAVEGTGAVPVLIPAPHGDLDSLVRAAELAKARGIPCLLDPILDPIHFGFTASLGRYAALRERLPDAEVLMGTGNLTELTDADSSGVTAMLMGVCSELAIRNVLVVQVSPHTRRTVAEHDLARRLMHAARANDDLPRGYAEGLLQVHDRRPYAQSAADIAAEVGGGARRQLPDRHGRGRHPRLQRPDARERHGGAGVLPRARRRGGWRARLLPGDGADEGRDRLPSRQALRAGRAAELGSRSAPSASGAPRPRRGRPYAESQGRPQGNAGCR